MALNYPKEFGTQWMNMKQDVKGLHTSANRRPAFTVIREGAFRVVDSDGDTQVIVGLLPNGNYGIASYNEVTGELVELNTIAFGIQADHVSTFQTTSSTSSTDLATYGPEVSVVIGNSGKAKVSLSAYVELPVPKVPANFIRAYGLYMGFQVSGATTVGVNQSYSLGYEMTIDTSSSGEKSSAETMRWSMTRTSLIEGLNPGVNTFTTKYKASGLATGVGFGDRSIVVEPY